jgi:hypothetical protein
MKRLILANATKLNALQTAINTALRVRQRSREDWQAWSDACDAFHAAYDSLAWPGGLGEGLALLKAGAPSAVETAVTYLEADPIYHRSGYLKVDVIRQLKHVVLRQEQVARLRSVVLARILGTTRREFRAYCHLAVLVQDAAFAQEIQALATHTDPRVVRHATWVLQALRHRAASRQSAT